MTRKDELKIIIPSVIKEIIASAETINEGTTFLEETLMIKEINELIALKKEHKLEILKK